MLHQSGNTVLSTYFPKQTHLQSESDDSGPTTIADSEITNYDVFCGRHKAAFNNIGNRRFRVTVGLALKRYVAAATRKDKSVVIKSVANLVQSNGGRFLTNKDGAWVQLSEKQAHEKVGHALRDMALTNKVESSTPAVPPPTSKSKRAINEAKSVVPRINQKATPEAPKVPLTAKDFFKPADASPTSSSVEPVHWNSEVAQLHRPSVDDTMLSWLIDESISILDPFAV